MSVGAAFAAGPPALESALQNFRTDGPRGWSYVQTTVAGKESLVEQFDARRPEFERWTLVERDGRPATPDEQRDYNEKQTRRSRGGTAPQITDSLDLATAEITAESAERTTYRCRLKKPEAGDTTAEFLRATLVLHRPTHTIESVTLENSDVFSPSLVVKINEMKTVMTFSLPAGDRPSLLLGVTVHVRGRAFFFKSLDQDMTVSYSGHVKATTQK